MPARQVLSGILIIGKMLRSPLYWVGEMKFNFVFMKNRKEIL